MITVEEKNFLEAYKKASYHRFYEIERYSQICEKLNKRSPQADKELTFWYTRTYHKIGESVWVYTVE